MKNPTPHILFVLLLMTSCTSQKKLAYLSNLPETSGEQYFKMDIPEYKIQPRDVLYITLKAMDPDGGISEYLGGGGSGGNTTLVQQIGGSYLFGYNVNKDGNIIIPILGLVNVVGKTLDEIREMLQREFEKKYRNAIVECKLLSFKFTVIGEVKSPGTYVNFSNYLTVLEAIGQAGGINDFGRRDNLLIVRPFEGGTKTFKISLRDKSILLSEAYFLLPNDVVIVESEPKKIFNLNFPTFAAILSTATSLLSTTLLLINYFGK
jgi:polysaccharide export outer membrane protein